MLEKGKKQCDISLILTPQERIGRGERPAEKKHVLEKERKKDKYLGEKGGESLEVHLR